MAQKRISDFFAKPKLNKKRPSLELADQSDEEADLEPMPSGQPTSSSSCNSSSKETTTSAPDLGPGAALIQAVTIQHEISFNDYMLTEAAEDSLVNLAVVIEDVKSQERVLASEEFNIRSPSLNIQIQNEFSVIINTPQVATVIFTNSFSVAVSGELTVSGSGLLEEKAQMRLTIQPRETMKKPVNFTPRMAGAKMLSASLVLMNPPTVLHGFKTINVQAS